MKDEDIQNLLGGFATSTLTESERELLFGAALHNQELFNALRVKGRGGLDHSAVITLLEDLAGVSA